MLRRALVALLLLGFSAATLEAQTYRQNGQDWEVSGFFGFATASSSSGITPTGNGRTLVVRQEFDDGWAGGFRVTQNVSSYFGGEFEYSVANLPGAFLSLTPTTPQFDFSQKVHNVTYNAVFYPAGPGAAAVPFLVVGAGVKYLDVKERDQRDALALGAELDNQLKFAFSFGGGVKFPLNDRWGLRFDVRDYVSGVPNYDLPPEAPFFPGDVDDPSDDFVGGGFRPDGVLHDFQATVGIIIYLDL